MKRIDFIISLLVGSFIGLSSTYATQYIILAEGILPADDVFVPYTTYAIVGDTILFVYVEGNHTTEAVTIPPGAATFASDLTNNVDTFIYVVTVPGTYYFDCHYAAFGGHGMDGYIEVSADPTSIGSEVIVPAISVFPNPFINYVNFEAVDADEIKVYTIVGQQVFSQSVKSTETSVVVNTRGLPAGVYFFSVMKNGQTLDTKKLTKN